MRTMGIAELKALLSETLDRVKGGEEVTVTEHDRPIARLVPLAAAAPATAAAATQGLAGSRLIRPPEKPLDESFWKLPRGEYRGPADDREEAEDWELQEAV